MNANQRESLLADLRSAVESVADRSTALLQVANMVRNSANYRWVGLYDGIIARERWSMSSGAELELPSTRSFQYPKG